MATKSDSKKRAPRATCGQPTPVHARVPYGTHRMSRSALANIKRCGAVEVRERSLKIFPMRGRRDELLGILGNLRQIGSVGKFG